MRRGKYQLLQYFIPGKIVGKGSIYNLRDWFGCYSNQPLRESKSKTHIALRITKFCNMAREEELP